MKYNKKLVLIGVPIIVALVVFLIIQQGKIEVSCNSDYDCFASCTGCIGKASFVLPGLCNVPSLPCKCIENRCQYKLLENSQTWEDVKAELETDYAANTTYWKINLSANGSEVEILVDAESGEVVQSYVDGGEYKIIDCVPAFYEIAPESDVWYYNTGCYNPEPTCDSGFCRSCMSSSDCLRKTKPLVISIDTEQTFTNYYYEIIGTGFTGSFDEAKSECSIMNDLYSNVTAQECEQMMLSAAKCESGQCKT